MRSTISSTGADAASVSDVSGLQFRVDGVGATSLHRDAVDGAVRESTRRAREPQQCRYGVGPRRDKLVFNICQNKANNFSRETLSK